MSRKSIRVTSNATVIPFCYDSVSVKKPGSGIVKFLVPAFAKGMLLNSVAISLPKKALTEAKVAAVMAAKVTVPLHNGTPAPPIPVEQPPILVPIELKSDLPLGLITPVHVADSNYELKVPPEFAEFLEENRQRVYSGLVKNFADIKAIISMTVANDVGQLSTYYLLLDSNTNSFSSRLKVAKLSIISFSVAKISPNPINGLTITVITKERR